MIDSRRRGRKKNEYEEKEEGEEKVEEQEEEDKDEVQDGEETHEFKNSLQCTSCDVSAVGVASGLFPHGIKMLIFFHCLLVLFILFSELHSLSNP